MIILSENLTQILSTHASLSLDLRALTHGSLANYLLLELLRVNEVTLRRVIMQVMIDSFAEKVLLLWQR